MKRLLVFSLLLTASPALADQPPIQVDITEVGGKEVSTAGVPVTVTNPQTIPNPLPVEVKNTDPFRVKIENPPTTASPLPVMIVNQPTPQSHFRFFMLTMYDGDSLPEGKETNGDYPDVDDQEHVTATTVYGRSESLPLYCDPGNACKEDADRMCGELFPTEGGAILSATAVHFYGRARKSGARTIEKLLCRVEMY